MATSRYEQDDLRVHSTAGHGKTFADIMARRLSRRGLLKGGVATSALVLFGQPLDAAAQATPGATPAGTPVGTPGATPGAASLAFEAIAPSVGDEIVVARGYTAVPFLAWGDPLTADAAPFDPTTLTAEEQARRVGYNHDFVGFLPLPIGSTSSDHGLLVVNHEYTNPELMFPSYMIPNPVAATPEPGGEEVPEQVPNPTAEVVAIELEAHGISVVEIRRNDAGDWEVAQDSAYNRRLTGTTPMTVTGPAAGHDLLKTSTDATGTEVLGTLNNCAGGLTPWGTYISCEENFHQYFGNLAQVAEDDPAYLVHERYGLGEENSERLWERFVDRFDLAKEPNEPFRFGWSVEIDPYDAGSTAKKRTALGRFRHEAVNLVVTPEGRIALYSGDDERFEYVYKFVTAGSYDPDDRAANMDLLDEGTLYVAKFNEDGGGEWMPLVQGVGPLTAENGFATQADILINTRGAADLLGATKMDRPEDMEHNPQTGKVYINLTNNDRRGTEGELETNAANPRPENVFGHVVELIEEGGDHAATTFGWDIFILCGDPADESTYFAGFPKDRVSAIANPDNMTFDLAGNLWLATDGQPRSLEINDGLYAVPTEGEERGYLRQFFSAVPGSEVSGPIFTPDNTSLFIAIQHPGEGGTFEEPVTSWPEASGPPRPALVVIRGENGGRIGSGE